MAIEENLAESSGAYGGGGPATEKWELVACPLSESESRINIPKLALAVLDVVSQGACDERQVRAAFIRTPAILPHLSPGFLRRELGVAMQHYGVTSEEQVTDRAIACGDLKFNPRPRPVRTNAGKGSHYTLRHLSRVVDCLVNNSGVAGIAAELGISLELADEKYFDVLHFLGARSNAHAVRCAYEFGYRRQPTGPTGRKVGRAGIVFSLPKLPALERFERGETPAYQDLGARNAIDALTKLVVMRRIAVTQRPPGAAFSARELEVASYIARGWSAEEISAELYIGVETVKTHSARLKRKAGVESREDLIAYLFGARWFIINP